MGTLRVPEATKASRRNTIVSALENLKKHVEATLKHVKEDDIIDLENIEVKGENLEPLFYQVTTGKDADLEKQERQEEVQKQFEEAQEQLGKSLDKFKEKVYAKMDEKNDAKFKEFMDKFEEMKKELNDNLNEHFETLASKEDTEKAIENIKKEIDEIRNTTKKRNSEVDEIPEKEKTPTVKTNRKYITFA
jgi:DNA repair ATPase RecN